MKYPSIDENCLQLPLLMNNLDIKKPTFLCLLNKVNIINIHMENLTEIIYFDFIAFASLKLCFAI